MKSEQFKFSSKTLAIRGNKEKEPTTKKRNWDRIIYLVLLGIIVVGLVYYLVNNYFIISGQGRVLANQFTVRAPIDITLVDLYSDVGKNVEKGDSLFSYSYISEQPDADSLIKIKEQKNEHASDLFDLREDATEKRRELQSLEEKLGTYQRRKERIEKEVKLHAETVGHLYQIEDDIIDIKGDIKAAKQQLNLLYQRQNFVQKQNVNAGRAGSENPVKVLKNSPRLYRSPVNGKVSNIFKEQLELALKSEEIISIQRDSAKVLIKAIFDRDYAPNVGIGTELNIRFDNGEPSRGIVTDLYAAEADLLPIFNLTGIEASDKIIIELKPVNENIRKQWRSLNGMSLNVSKTLF